MWGKISLESFPELGSALTNQPWEGSVGAQPMVPVSRQSPPAEPMEAQGAQGARARPAPRPWKFLLGLEIVTHLWLSQHRKNGREIGICVSKHRLLAPEREH